jgi:hypothetical protein
MKLHRRHSLVVLSLLATLSTPAHAQGRPDATTLLAAQRVALKELAFMDGAWRGTAWTMLPSGEKHAITQTERIGPFLDGAVKVIEGRGYEADGKPIFNAFGTVSFDPAQKSYTLHSHAMGMVGDFKLTPTVEGYIWEIPAGPMIIRYTAAIKDGKWREIGERVFSGKAPIQFFEMNLVRVGDTDWPAAGAVSAKEATQVTGK